jgi:signal peptidase II
VKIFQYFFLFSFCFGLDRWTKWWALSNNVDFQVYPFLDFFLLWNRGISWGIFSNTSPYGFFMLTIVIFLIIGLFTYYAFYNQWYKRNEIIFLEILVIAGAVSNFFDRCIFGGVIDFIQLHVGDWYWPTFNLADMFIVVGVVGLMIKNMRGPYGNKNQKMVS